MWGITTTQREEEDDDDITTRVRPPPITLIPQESDTKSTSSGTQKKSNKRKDRLVVVPNKSSFLQQLASQQRARQKQRRKQQQQQILLATAQASTTAMFCPVPWFILPPREPQDKSARSITSTIPPQEYLSYQSNDEPSDSCSDSSGIELGEPQPKRCLEESSSIQTPPPTTNKTRALTPETQAMTEAEDESQQESVSSETSSTSRMELPRPRALLFEESMKKIEQETQLSQLQDELFVAEADASTTTMLSPLRFIVFAIILALLAANGSDKQSTTLVPVEPSETIPKASAASILQPTEQHHADSIEASTLEEVAPIEFMTQHETDTMIQEASIQAAREQAQTIRQEALQTAQSIQQQAIEEASIQARIQAQQIRSEALAEIAQEALELKEAARTEAASIKQAALQQAAMLSQSPLQNQLQNLLQKLWTKLVNLREKLFDFRIWRKQRRKEYKESLLQTKGMH